MNKQQIKIKNIKQIKQYVISISTLSVVLLVINIVFYVISINVMGEMGRLMLSLFALIFTSLIAFFIIYVEVKGYAQLRSLTYFDELTGLNNNTRLIKIVEEYIRNEESKLSIVSFGMNSFSTINQRYGNVMADSIVKIIGDELKSNSKVIEPTRIESDNFIFLVQDNDEEKVKIITTNLLSLIRDRIIKEKNTNVDFLAGVCIYNKDVSGARDLIDKAKIAKSIADYDKEHYVVFDLALKNKLISESVLVDDMLTGLLQGDFKVYYQPKYNIITGKMIGLEALVRWLHPKHGYIPPNSFIKIAENKNLLWQIDAYVFEQVCKDINKWASSKKGVYMPVAVNCERNMLESEEVFNSRFEIMNTYGVKSSDIEFEVTERNAILDNKRANRVLEKVRKKGCSVAIDDFGSGYSSLSMLRSMPITTIKLDKGFIKRVMYDEADRKIVSSLVDICNTLGVEVIAEGIETIDQLNFILDCGVYNAQGFLLDFPLLEEVVAEKFSKNDIMVKDKEVLKLINQRQNNMASNGNLPIFNYREVLKQIGASFFEVDLTSNMVLYKGLKENDKVSLYLPTPTQDIANSYDNYLKYYVKNLVIESDQKRLLNFLSKRNLLNELNKGNNSLKIEFRLFENTEKLTLGEITVEIIEEKTKIYAIIKYRNINKK